MKKILTVLALTLAVTAAGCGQIEKDDSSNVKPAEQISEIRDEFPQYSAECCIEKCSPEESPKYAINDTEQKNRILSLYNKAVNESTEIEFDSEYDILIGGERLILSLTQDNGTVISVLLQADKDYDENKLSRGNILCCISNVNDGNKQDNVSYSSYRCGSETYNELYSELESIMGIEA